MGYWENTAYIRTRDIDRIVEAVTRLCAEEHYRVIRQPAPREPDDRDPMQYGLSDENPLWAIAVIPGPTEWTALKTAPLELLIERSSPRSPMRLARLSRLLGADAFQYNVYDSAEVILVETSSSGVVRASGQCEQCPGIEGLDRDDPPPTYNGEPLHSEHFTLIDVSGGIRAAVEAFADDAELGLLLCGETGGHENLIQVNHLIPHKPLSISGARSLYFRRVKD